MANMQKIQNGLGWPVCYFIGGLTGVAYLHFALDWGWLQEGIVGGIAGGISLGFIVKAVSMQNEVAGNWIRFRGISMVSCIMAFAGLFPAFWLATLSLKFAALFSIEEYPPFVPWGLRLLLPILCFAIFGVFCGLAPGFIKASIVIKK